MVSPPRDRRSVTGCRFVAEFTTNHMGNLNVLLRMVERAAAAGCALIKMQKKDVESFYSREKLDAPYQSPYGKTYRDYRTVFEFSEEDFGRFDARCREHGVEWFCTVQDLPSLDFMLGFDLRHYKVASCNARNRPMLEECGRRIPTDRTVVVSVAGSTLAQIEEALEIFHRHRVWLLHCVAEYPCPPDKVRLGNLVELGRRFAGDRVTVGYSGHEQGLAPSLAAVGLGAAVIERHFCLSRHSFVHHIECSLEPEEFRELVQASRDRAEIERASASLPRAAFATSFGMSAVERTFLVEQTYGTRFIHDGSDFPASEATATAPAPKAA